MQRCRDAEETDAEVLVASGAPEEEMLMRVRGMHQQEAMHATRVDSRLSTGSRRAALGCLHLSVDGLGVHLAVSVPGPRTSRAPVVADHWRP